MIDPARSSSASRPLRGWRRRRIRCILARVTAAASEPYVALLRGINVGGKRPLPMKELAALFAACGGREVSTYLQSGNVIFRAGPREAARIPEAVAAAIRERFGLAVPLLLRSAGELGQVARGNPFIREGAAPETLHVAFLAERPAAKLVAALDPDRSPGDRFAVLGREVFLHCPNGFARTKLTNAWIDSRLATVSTVRNWRTVQKLLELASG